MGVFKKKKIHIKTANVKNRPSEKKIASKVILHCAVSNKDVQNTMLIFLRPTKWQFFEYTMLVY